MNYIIMDLEWNQAIGRQKMVTSPVLLRGEIIQIGAVKTDEDFKLVDKIKINVRPKYYTVMNEHVRKITGINDVDLTFGETFKQAFKRFSMWCGEDFRFITWGFDDLSVFSDNLLLHGIDTPFGEDFINLQIIYKNQIDNERSQWSLSDAMSRLEIPMDNNPHDAFNDAWFTYEVCTKLDMKQGIADYGQYRSEFSKVKRKDVLRDVVNYSHNNSDSCVTETKCPMCEAVLKTTGAIFYGTRRLVASECAEHGQFIIKMTAKREEDGKWSVIKVIRTADEKDMEAFRKKQERQAHNLELKDKENSDDKNGDV